MKQKKRKQPPGAPFTAALGGSDGETGSEQHLWAAEMLADKAGIASEALSTPPTAALSYSDFVVALKGALREFSRLDLLNDNPLLRLRLLASKSHARPADLQALVTQTVETLFASPRDEKLRRVVELTYFRPLPKQEAAAERLSLSFGTYRRHLTTAVGRLARWLWDREQAAWANESPLDAQTADVEEKSPSIGPPHPRPRLSIVVLPFLNLRSGEGQDHFVDGITESLTTDISRIPGALVIARNTAFSYKDKAIDARQIGSELGVRYVMEGSVQSDGSRIRVNAQLVDAETGAHLWAERFDKPLADFFDMQDEIVARVARTLDEKLIAVEVRRAKRNRSANPDALDRFYSGWAAFNRGHNYDNLTEAEQLFEQALTLEPDNVDALAGLAMAKYAMAVIYATEDRAAYFKAAEATATKALALSPDHARAHAALAYIYMSTNRPVLGIAEAQRALSLDQSLAPCHAAIGLGKTTLGRAEETEGHILQALRLSPRDSFVSAWCMIAGMAKLFLGRDEEAVDWLFRAVEANKTYPQAHLTLAAALAHQGRIVEARAAAAAGLALAPTFTIRRFTDVLSNNPTYLAQRERLYEGMRIAGVPQGEPQSAWPQGSAHKDGAAPSDNVRSPVDSSRSQEATAPAKSQSKGFRDRLVRTPRRRRQGTRRG